MWKPQANGVYQSWINCIDTQKPKLTAWEVNFLFTMRGNLRVAGFIPSRAQAETLETIYANKTK